MYDFLLQIFFFGALTVIVYLMARALPRVPESNSHVSALEYIDGWLRRLPLAKADHFINLRFEKTLRRIRVLILRADNLIHRYLNNKKNGGGERDSGLLDELKK